MSRVKEIIKNNTMLYTVVKKIRYVQYGIWQPFMFNTGVILRKYGLIKLPIKKYKDKYCGERCFILATGPSMTLEDIKILRNEYTFGMNTICKTFSNLGWETTFLGIQDYKVYGALKNTIENASNCILLLGGNLRKRYHLPKHAVVFPLDLMNHDVHPTDCYETDFSDDCSIRVYDGYTITYSLIQIAAFMGFKEIYLLGCDCGYSGDKHHFIEHGVKDPNFESAQERMFFSYRIAKQYADADGIKIFNATRGGALEIFPRVKLEDVVGER